MLFSPIGARSLVVVGDSDPNSLGMLFSQKQVRRHLESHTLYIVVYSAISKSSLCTLFIATA